MRRMLFFAASLFVVAFAVGAYAGAVVLVDQNFSGATDPLSYLYQDAGVSTDSFGFSDPNDNMWGEARRGRQITATTPPSTAERAYVGFDMTGNGDGDQYLEYTEAFDFAFDFNFSSFVATANDERLLAGLWYSPADAGTDNSAHYRDWANRQHFVGATIEEDASEVRFYILFSNGGDWSGKAKSDDLTGAGSLSTGVNYRIEGSYRWDGATYGQVFGTLTNLDTGSVMGQIAQQVITSDTDVYSVAFCNMTADTANRRFMKSSTLGVGNETWGTTRLDGPEFTSDNWYLAHIPEPGALAVLLAAIGVLGFRARGRI